ncbi:MAG: iron ABC transporter permease [Candidatus Omnitrophica bacterium]|nr:iron ABC transporter permease [Candidatus Omnitrophota bacterium]
MNASNSNVIARSPEGTTKQSQIQRLLRPQLGSRLAMTTGISPGKLVLIIVFFVAILFVTFLVSLLSGAAHVEWGTSEGQFILMQLRLPRTLLAFLVGMALSLAGAVFQALLRNPLADPHLLGVSAGGALGVVVGSGFLIAGSFVLAIPVLSLLGSLAAVMVVYRFSLRKGALSLYTLLLIGVVMNSLFISVIVLVQSLVRSDELTTVLFWLLGNLSFASYPRLFAISVIIFTAAWFLLRQARKLNILSFGESTAHSLGVPIERTKKIIFLVASLLTGIAVSMSGMIGFVGLIVPHLARLLFGSDYRKLLPTSAVLGGIVLILSDSLARVIVIPQELPVGVVTAFLGAPFFIYLLKRQEAKRVI